MYSGEFLQYPVVSSLTHLHLKKQDPIWLTIMLASLRSVSVFGLDIIARETGR